MKKGYFGILLIIIFLTGAFVYSFKKQAVKGQTAPPKSHQIRPV